MEVPDANQTGPVLECLALRLELAARPRQRRPRAHGARSDPRRDRRPGAPARRCDLGRAGRPRPPSRLTPSFPCPNGAPGRTLGLLLYWVVKGALTPVLGVCFRVKVEGRENLPRRGPVILASNHRSFLD